MITVVQCELPDLDRVIARYPDFIFWDISMTHLDGVPVNEATIIPHIAQQSGTYVINGLIRASGIDRNIQYQLINLYRTSPDTQVVLISPQVPIPSDLYPFVSIEVQALPDGATVQGILNDHGIDDPGVVRSFLGLTHGEIDILLKRFGSTPDLSQKVLKYKVGKLQSLGFTLMPEPDVQVAGLDLIGETLDRAAALLNLDAKKYNLKFPKGVLLWGVPGVGKSLTAKHAAQRMGIPLIAVDWSGILDPEPGKSEANLRSLLNIAEAQSPCIIYMDDFDKAFSSGDLSNVSSVEKRIAGILLTWLQDCDKPVYFMASVNRAEQMPPELKRRFDDIFFIGFPHQGMMKEIFDNHIAQYTETFEATNLEWQQILRKYSRCTPAEIGLAVRRCAEQCYFENRPGSLTVQDILNQREKFISSYTRDQSMILRIESNADLAMPATSDDDSVFRIEASELFQLYQGDN